MRNVRSVLLGLALALLCAACYPGASAPIFVSQAEAGTTITLQRGETLVVTLPGNITTGYNWEMVPQDPAVLRQIGAPEVTPASNLIGAPGNIVLKFEGAQAGQASLKLVYRRPWEKDVPPLETFQVTVIVK